MQLSRWFVTVTLIASATVFCGCPPRALYQTPRVLSDGEYLVGAGLACNTAVPDYGEDLMFTGSAVYRASTGDDSDAGFALHLTPGYGATAAADSRWPLARGPFLVTGRAGVSLTRAWSGEGWLVALEPGALFGSDRVWGILSCPLNWALDGIWLPIPTAYVGLGARIGSRLQLLPELGCNWFWVDGPFTTGWILGLGIQYGSGGAQGSYDLFGKRTQPIPRPPI